MLSLAKKNNYSQANVNSMKATPLNMHGIKILAPNKAGFSIS